MSLTPWVINDYSNGLKMKYRQYLAGKTKKKSNNKAQGGVIMNIAIVGAGRGGRSILAAIHGLTGVNCVGIADLSESAPGMVLRVNWV